MTPGASRPHRRRLLVDAGLAVVAVVYGLVVQPQVVRATPLDELSVLEVGTALVAISSLWWLRRPHPEWFAALAVASTFLCDLTGALPPIALATIALHRSWRRTAAAGVAMTVVIVAQVWLDPPESPLNTSGGTVVIFAATAGWAIAVRNRRQVVALLRQQVEEAARVAEQRAEDARRDERARIARDMHDTLAHRMSLLAIHGSALVQRTEGASDDAREIATTMRTNARESLEDLRWMMGLLQDDADAEGTLRPTPGPADVPHLVKQASSINPEIALDVQPDWDALDTLSAPVGHVLYRVVQESLTNSRMHGVGGPVRIQVVARPERCVEVSVVDSGPGRRGQAEASPVPGSGRGLIGLEERVRAVGGSFDHGPGHSAGNGYRVHAVLPWTPRPTPDADERPTVGGIA